jgi:hypothetical protein
VTYYRLTTGTAVASVAGLQAALAAGTAVAASPKDAGNYVAFASYAGDANHTGSAGVQAFAIARQALDVDATTQGTINIGSNGSIDFTLSVTGGIVDGRSVYALFNGVTVTIEVCKGDGSVSYGTLTSVAAVNADGTISVSLTLSDALKAELYQVYVNGGSVDFRLSAVSTAASGGNYLIEENAFARLLNNGRFRYVV